MTRTSKALLAGLILLPLMALAELPSGDEATIGKALSSGRPTLVDFGARTCIPCKQMAPILEELSKEYQGRVNVIFIDVWQNDEIGRHYRVMLIPTQVFYDKNGLEMTRHMGFMEKEAIIKTLRGAGVK